MLADALAGDAASATGLAAGDPAQGHRPRPGRDGRPEHDATGRGRASHRPGAARTASSWSATAGSSARSCSATCRGRADHPALRPRQVLGPAEPGALLLGGRRPARRPVGACPTRRGLRVHRRHRGADPRLRAPLDAGARRHPGHHRLRRLRDDRAPAARRPTRLAGTLTAFDPEGGPRMTHPSRPARPSSSSATAWSATGFVEAAVERGLDRDLRRRGGRRGAATGVRPGRADLVLRRSAPTSSRCSRRRRTTTRGCAWCSAPRSPRSTARPGTVRLADGAELAYDALVLATGSAPFVPPVPGHDLAGCFVYRTIDDLEAISEAAARRHRPASSSAAGCSAWRRPTRCAQLGLDTHVVEMAPRLMPLQVDEGGGAVLARHVEELGLTVHTGAATSEVLAEDGRVVGLGAARRRPGADRPRRLLRRHPAARRARPGRRPGGRRARRRRGRRALPHRGRARLGDRRVRGARRAGCTGWSRPATRWPRSWPTRCSAARAPSPAPTCPPSSSCSASTWPPSATRTRPPRARSS